jgi:hypothetical protein
MIHPQNHRLPLAHRNHPANAKTITFSLQTLSLRSPAPATQNHSLAVQNLWTMKLPCGRMRKTKNEHFESDFLSTMSFRTGAKRR